jgi:hypothetical protein
MKVTGKVQSKLPAEKGTTKAGKEWIKQSIVIDTEAQFNPLVCISFFGDEKIKLIKDLKKGDKVDVAINISSREFNSKWYHNIDGWAVENAQANDTNNTPAEDGLPF